MFPLVLVLVLDTEIWMGIPERTENLPKICREAASEGVEARSITKKLVPVILFNFYKKPMACKVPNRANNALPEQ